MSVWRNVNANAISKTLTYQLGFVSLWRLAGNKYWSTLVYGKESWGLLFRFGFCIDVSIASVRVQ